MSQQKKSEDYLPEHIRNWFSSLDFMAVLFCVLVKKPVGYYYIKNKACSSCGVKIECYTYNKEQIEKRENILTQMRRHDFTKGEWVLIPQEWVCLTQEHAKAVKPILNRLLTSLDAVKTRILYPRDSKLILENEKTIIEAVLASIVSQLEED